MSQGGLSPLPVQQAMKRSHQRPSSAVGQGSSMLDPANFPPGGSVPVSSPIRGSGNSASNSNIDSLDLSTSSSSNLPLVSSKAKVTLVGRSAPFTVNAMKALGETSLAAGGSLSFNSESPPSSPMSSSSTLSPPSASSSSSNPKILYGSTSLRIPSSKVSSSSNSASPGSNSGPLSPSPSTSASPSSSASPIPRASPKAVRLVSSTVSRVPPSVSFSGNPMTSSPSPSPSPTTSSSFSPSASGPLSSTNSPSSSIPSGGTMSMRGGVVKLGNAHGTPTGPARFVDVVSPEVLSSLSKDERDRQEVIFEMIKTEKQFLADLHTVVRVFLQPLREKELLNKQQIAGLFSNIEALIDVNQKLLYEFETRQKENPVISSIGEVFAVHGDMLKLYAVYCSNQPLIPPTIAALSRQFPAFASFLKECSAKPECRAMLLTDFLIQPMQRVCKYPLLLRSILKATPPSHGDYGNLVAGLQIIEKVVNQVNARTKQVENVMKLKEIQARLVFPKDKTIDLVTHDRFFGKEGPAKILKAEKKGGKEVLRDHYLFLLSDMLLISIPLPARKPGKDGVLPPQYQMDKVIPLFEPNTANIIELLPIDSSSLEISELQRSGGGKVRLELSSSTERDEWQTAIETITIRYADNWNRNVKRFSMFTRESNEVAPKGPRPTISKGPAKALPSGPINRPTPPSSSSSSNERLEKRVQELEEEVRTLKMELDEERHYYLKQIQELNDQLAEFRQSS